MGRDIKEILVALAIIITIIGVFFGIVFWVHSEQCEAKWEASGLISSWGFIKGCTVSTDGIRWIPSSSYRHIGDN